MIKSITHSFSAQRKIGTFFYHALMIVVSFLMLYPVLWLVASSFKPNGDIFSTATSLFPENFTLEHYINGWKGFGCKRAGRMRTRAERTCKKLFFPANRIIKPFFG